LVTPSNGEPVRFLETLRAYTNRLNW
jgi:hypothetical protein